MANSLNTHCRKGTGSLEGNREQGAGNRDLGGLPAKPHQATQSGASPCGYVDNTLALGDAFADMVSNLEFRAHGFTERHPVIRNGIERTPLANPVRLAVLLRDVFRCARCGFNVRREAAQIDHIKPWSAGGTDTTDNLRAMCTACNQERSNFIDPSEAPAFPATFWCDGCVGAVEATTSGLWLFQPAPGHECWFCRQDWWQAAWSTAQHRPADSPLAAIATPVSVPARCLHCKADIETQWSL